MVIRREEVIGRQKGVHTKTVKPYIKEVKGKT